MEFIVAKCLRFPFTMLNVQNKSSRNYIQMENDQLTISINEAMIPFDNVEKCFVIVVWPFPFVSFLYRVFEANMYFMNQTYKIEKYNKLVCFFSSFFAKNVKIKWMLPMNEFDTKTIFIDGKSNLSKWRDIHTYKNYD